MCRSDWYKRRSEVFNWRIFTSFTNQRRLLTLEFIFSSKVVTSPVGNKNWRQEKNCFNFNEIKIQFRVWVRNDLNNLHKQNKKLYKLKKKLAHFLFKFQPTRFNFYRKEANKTDQIKKKVKFCSHDQNAEGISFKIKNDFLPKNQTDTYESTTINIVKLIQLLLATICC